MTSSEVKDYFSQYVLPPEGFIYRDIKREIDLGRAGDQGGSFLAALGLVCYTEFMGSVSLQGDGSYTKQFKAFFRRLGEDYARLVDDKEIDVYRVFRSGLVHSYLTKDCEIKMLKDGNEATGITINPDGSYLFIVEKYFEDFVKACEELYQEFLALGDVYLPSM